MKRILTVTTLAAAMTTSAFAKDPQLAPDLVIVNASVHTMDKSKPIAEAVAVAGNRIVAVGSTAEIKAMAGKPTRVVDAKGRVVFPGFNDAHVHYLMGGFSLSRVDLRDALNQGGRQGRSLGRRRNQKILVVAEVAHVRDP